MRILLSAFCMLLIAFSTSCDFRSGIAKDNMDKYTTTPTPAPSLTPVEAPIESGEIVEVDIKLGGDPVSINGRDQNKTGAFTKFNRMTVNGTGNTVTIKGPCRQIMVNGDENTVIADAAMEFVLNGTGNTIRYSRYVNGKRPSVRENRVGNVVEKISSDAMTGNRSRSKLDK
ncbi:MAG: DUF3060 domain-containing protein [Blastocatellia bacterium]|nr:DUF3060 domain-containing protein [Blastocatellia bacterium]